ncbi:MAG: hypothetical protein IKK57_05055 [Clostridia bacterium]|nr:hypothetical protein [Clostridia bacterium]
MMKRFLALILAVLLMAACTTASASGLAGLLGGTTTAQPVPDPVKVTGAYGSLLAENYQFSADYLCDAYVYAKPDDVREFVNMYTVSCRQAGYSVTAATIDGAQAYTIQRGDGSYACLFPDYGGQMLLLIQKGMTFELQSRTNYATIIYNNLAYELEMWSAEEWLWFDAWNLYFKCDRGVIKYIQITLPRAAVSGDEYYVSGKDHVEGFSLMLDMEKELLGINAPLFGVRSDAIENSRDYAHVVVHTVRDVEGGVLIEGEFNGSFDKGTIIIEDFIFSAIVEK